MTKFSIRNAADCPRGPDWTTFQVRTNEDPHIGKTSKGLFYEMAPARALGHKLVHIRTPAMGPFEIHEDWIDEDILIEAVPDSDLFVGFSPMPILEVKLGGETRLHAYARVSHTSEGRSACMVEGTYILGDGLFLHLWIRSYRDSPTRHIWGKFSFCDVESDRVRIDLDEVKLTFGKNDVAVIDFAEARGMTPAGREIILFANDWLGHGQGFAFTGRVIDTSVIDDPQEMLTAHANTQCPLFSARETSFFGPGGMIHDWPRSALRRRELDMRFARVAQDQFRPGTVWKSPVYYEGVADQPMQGGDQAGFGVTKLWDVIEGRPQNLYWWLPSVLREACRPQFFYESGGQFVTKGGRPGYKSWDWAPHYHPSISDQLGKIPWGPRPYNQVAKMDWAHSGVVHVCAYAELTGDPLAYHMVENYTELLYATHGSFGEARGWGRAMLSMAWCDYARPSENLSALMNTIADADVWDEVNSRPGPRTAFEIKKSHPRWGDAFTMPWQEGHLVSGAWLAYRQFDMLEGDPMDVAIREIARSLITYDCHEFDGQYHTAWALTWDEGKPVVPFGSADGSGLADEEAMRALLAAAYIVGASRIINWADDMRKRQGNEAGGDDWSDWLVV